MSDPNQSTMRALQFKEYGNPASVLKLCTSVIPTPAPQRVRVRVHACGLNPMDWALCAGFMTGDLPGGIGLDVSGTVDALGEGVTDIRVGDLVFGRVDFTDYPTAGASEYAILSFWTSVPDGLDPALAAALPMVVETAVRAIDLLNVSQGQTIVVNGGGTMTGFAAVQIALMRGATVIATSGKTFADRLQALGAKVTPYGDGVVERVREIAGGSPDLVLHTAQVKDALPDLIRIVGGDPSRVMSISDFDDQGLGVRTTGREQDLVPRYDSLAPFAKMVTEGRFEIPIAGTFKLEGWHEALELSQTGRAHGKLLLIP